MVLEVLKGRLASHDGLDEETEPAMNGRNMSASDLCFLTSTHIHGRQHCRNHQRCCGHIRMCN